MRSMPDCLACRWNSTEPDGSDERARSIAMHRAHFCKGGEASTREYGVRFVRRYWDDAGVLQTEEETVGPWTEKYAKDKAKRMNCDPHALAVVVTRAKTIVTTPWKETS